MRSAIVVESQWGQFMARSSSRCPACIKNTTAATTTTDYVFSSDTSAQFATTYRLPIPKEAPFAIGYVFDGKPHDYLPDVVGTLTTGRLLIAEAGMEDEKRQDRQQAKAEAARRLARARRGVYWIATEQQLPLQRHYNLVFLHARRQGFAAFTEIEASLYQVWPWGEVACIKDLVPRLAGRWQEALVEAAIWKVVADNAARGRLLVDLSSVPLSRELPLALLSPESTPIVPDPLPDTLPPAHRLRNEFSHIIW
jgi:hypothetical protein